IKAYLTYAGTQVKADGTIYLTTGTTGNADGAYAKGSYISFTAPQKGTLVVVGNKLARWDGTKYSGSYSNSEITFTINAKADDI
ncbi:MAG: hypothetical protein IJR33_00400, partial [Clostridia bacterium]|nr:hypothetical protein [Clostridia bacterium]